MYGLFSFVFVEECWWKKIFFLTNMVDIYLQKNNNISSLARLIDFFSDRIWVTPFLIAAILVKLNREIFKKKLKIILQEKKMCDFHCFSNHWNICLFGSSAIFSITTVSNRFFSIFFLFIFESSYSVIREKNRIHL